ncbi:WbqC family protein [Flavobacteriaceae bacterium]|jgi:hypothetical protein|nr:WbqC family protein [Flavobacteriaceae bacterium]
MNILLNPTYFANILHWSAIVKSKQVNFEVCDSYQKQTYRNRTHIYGANGRLALSIPIIYSQNNRQMYRDIKIYNNDRWQSLHWKSLVSAYGTSPFFEFYKDDIEPLFHTKQVFLMDFNFKCFEIIQHCLDMEIDYFKTTSYEKEITQIKDMRSCTSVRKEKQYNFLKYTQVFEKKCGFISNLSILDLLFNEGPNTVIYLNNQYTP